MDWHEGIDRAKRHLAPEQIGQLVGCPRTDVDAYVNRDREPGDELGKRFETLGDQIERQEQADLDSGAIKQFWTGGEPGELLKNERFDELSTMVDKSTSGARQF